MSTGSARRARRARRARAPTSPSAARSTSDARAHPDAPRRRERSGSSAASSVALALRTCVPTTRSTSAPASRRPRSTPWKVTSSPDAARAATAFECARAARAIVSIAISSMSARWAIVSRTSQPRAGVGRSHASGVERVARTSCSCVCSAARSATDAPGGLTAGSRPPDPRAAEAHRHLGRMRHRRRARRDAARRGTSRPARRRRRRACGAARAPSTCRRARRAVNASFASVHHQQNSSPPSPQPSRPNSVRIVVIDSSSSSRSTARNGSCQHTVGLVSLKCLPCPLGVLVQRATRARSRSRDGSGRRTRRRPGACASRPCRPSSTRPSACPACGTATRRRRAPRRAARSCFMSFLSDACAPYEQQPWTSSGAGSVSTPWQPWPKMQRYDDARNVTSICHCRFSLPGTGIVIHSRVGAVIGPG